MRNRSDKVAESWVQVTQHHFQAKRVYASSRADLKMVLDDLEPPPSS
jgi:hypothetical protein